MSIYNVHWQIGISLENATYLFTNGRPPLHIRQNGNSADSMKFRNLVDHTVLLITRVCIELLNRHFRPQKHMFKTKKKAIFLAFFQ